MWKWKKRGGGGFLTQGGEGILCCKFFISKHHISSFYSFSLYNSVLSRAKCAPKITDLFLPYFSPFFIKNVRLFGATLTPSLSKGPRTKISFARVRKLFHPYFYGFHEGEGLSDFSLSVYLVQEFCYLRKEFVCTWCGDKPSTNWESQWNIKGCRRKRWNIHDIYFQDPSEHARIFYFDISSGNKIMYCFKPSSSFNS